MKGEFKIEPKWKRSSEEVWTDHFEQLTSAAVSQVDEKGRDSRRVRLPDFRGYALYYAAAAVIIMLLIPLMYTKNISASRGEHLSYVLPDGSQVTINAESKLSFKPLVWFISRGVKMDGEVLFEVKKGSGFTVKSSNGIVRVLGTTFNVISRDSRFEVACIEGRVEVSAKAGEVERQKVVSSISWRGGDFYFTAVSVKAVIDEIARQYNVEIELEDMEEMIYTGNFSGKTSLEEVLDIVAIPFSLKVEKTEKGYILYR